MSIRISFALVACLSASLVSAAEFGSQYASPWGSVFPGQESSPFGTQLMGYAPTTGAASAGSLASSATSKAWNYLLPGLGVGMPDWAKRVEMEVSVRDKMQPAYSVLTVQPLYQDAEKQNTIFIQASQLRYDMFGKYRDTSNIGLGYRHLMFGNSMLVGANAFFDHEWTYSHQRVGFGGELKWAMLDANANIYNAISSTKTISTGVTERAMSGWDAELLMKAPYMPWLQVGAQRFEWNSAWGTDTKGWRYSALADISQNLSFEAGWINSNNGTTRAEAYGKFVLRLARSDRPVMFSDKFLSKDIFEQRDMRTYTLDKVRRENRIIVERKTTTGTGAVVVARGN